MENEGRPFRCSTCKPSIAKLRHCNEDKWDFEEKDSSVFPIQIDKGGTLFSFCPAKVRRDDQETIMIFNTLIAIIQTGTWPDSGGINEQEDFWVELVSEFSIIMDELKFNRRLSIVAELVSAAFGGGKGGKNGLRKK